MVQLYQTLHDQQLLDLLQEGDENALAAIYERYWAKLYLQAYNVIGDRCVSEDIVQDIIVQLWTKRAVNNIASLKPYLYACVRYQVFAAIRAGKRIEPLEQQDHQAVNDTDSTILEKDILRLLDLGVAELPTKCREIFTMSRKDHLTTKEIALRLGLSPKTVENQITIAIRKLRAVMQEVLLWIALVMVFHS